MGISTEFCSLYDQNQSKLGVSENRTLERLLGNSSYLLREWYAPLPQNSFATEMENHNLDPRLVSFAQSNIGQIITPQQYRLLNQKSYRVRLLSVTGESGRAIEIPTNNINLLATQSRPAITMKGVGSTWYAREQSSMSRYIPIHDRDIASVAERSALRALSYYQSRGVLNLKDAIYEYNTSLDLINQGVENIQTPISVVRLNSIYSAGMEMQSTEKCKRKNILFDG